MLKNAKNTSEIPFSQKKLQNIHGLNRTNE